MKSKEWSGGHRSQHIVAKIVCLFLAVVLWLYVMYVVAPEYSEVYDNIYVSVVTDTNFKNGEIDNPLISVRVRGTKQALMVNDDSSVTACVRLADLSEFLNENGELEKFVYDLPVYFVLPDGLTVDGEYTIPVSVREK